MTFASKDFILYFFPLFLIFYFACKRIRAKNIVFIVFSLIFYSAARPLDLLILLVSIGANSRLALPIDLAENARRYSLLAYGAAGNLALLGVFKYTGFLVENANALLGIAGVHSPVPRIPL